MGFGKSSVKGPSAEAAVSTLTNESKMEWEDYKAFWKSTLSNQNSKFLALLMKSILVAIGNGKDKRNANKKDWELIIGSVVNSMIYMRLFHPECLDPVKASDLMSSTKEVPSTSELHRRFIEVMKEYEEIDIEHPEKDLGNLFDFSLRDFINLQRKPISEDHSTASILNDFPFTLVYYQFIFQHSRGEYGRILWTRFIFNFEYLLKMGMSRNSDNSRKRSTSRISDDIAANSQLQRCTALIRLLIELLCRCPIVDPGVLEHLLVFVKPILFWSKPYSSLAQNAIKVLENEILNPGSTGRQKRCSIYRDGDSPIYCLWDAFGSGVVRHIIDDERSSLLPATVNTRQMLLNILLLGVSYSNVSLKSVGPELLKALLERSDDQVFSMFKEVSDRNFTEQSSEKESRKRLNMVCNLCPGLSKYAKTLKRTCSISADKLFDFMGDCPESIPDKSKIGPLIDSQIAPDVVGGRLTITCVDFVFDQVPTAEAEDTNKPGSFVKDAHNIIDYNDASLELLSQLEKARVSEDKICRLVVLGDTKVLHYFACKLLSIAALLPDLLKEVSIKIFVIPSGLNDWSAFLARRDTWYNKCIFAPFSTNLLMCPVLDTKGLMVSSPRISDEQVLEDENPFIQLPTNSLRQCIFDYISGANETFSVPVFECHCFEEKESVIIIPMVTRMELGLNAAICQFDTEGSPELASRRTSSSFSSESSAWSPSSSLLRIGRSGSVSEHVASHSIWEKVLLDKHFIRSGIGPGNTCDLKVSLLLKGFVSDHRTKELPSSIYQSIIITSVPASKLPCQANGYTAVPESFCTKENNGTVSELSVQIIPLSKRSSLNDILRARDKKLKDLELLRDAFMAEEVSETIEQIEIKSISSTLFRVAIDGVLYGPFKKVICSRSTKLKSIPVQHFLP